MTLMFNHSCLLWSIWTWNFMNSYSKKMRCNLELTNSPLLSKWKILIFLLNWCKIYCSMLKGYISSKGIKFFLQKDYLRISRKIIHQTHIKLELAIRNYRRRSPQITMNFIKTTNTGKFRRRKMKLAKFS